MKDDEPIFMPGGRLKLVLFLVYFSAMIAVVIYAKKGLAALGLIVD
jgi:hypothetical protein